nr:MAG TPA: tail-collar fiber protein [Caudoviricetes sp.]
MSEISLDPILTDAGLAALQNSDATGIAAKITHIALGDVGATPIPSVQALQNERLRVACFSGGITGNRQITLTANVAAGTPEFFVKEIGFFLEDGTLFAFWSHPEQALGYRSQTTPWFFKFVLSWNVAGTVDVVFDTTAVLACISQDTAVLESKIRHTIESEDITPSDDDETQLTDAIEKKIDEHSPDITVISATSGTVALNANTLYKMTISGATTFTLPSAVNAEKHNQIKILTNLSVVSAINFGTTKYFNCEAPDMSEAGLYDIYIDYDPHQSSWVAGAIRKGAAA